MPLDPGDHLGAYEVTAFIGEGGMGRVYRATDRKLRRDVALKILPDEFADNPDRLLRFQREAQVLASLNHSNIGGIYGLEEASGVRALVLELVEGPTLADRIKQGPIPLTEALTVAKQIGQAIEAAHEAGVIHRDLKPANIKLRGDGVAKVLDFGLAKAGEARGATETSQSPTETTTAPGVVVGTAAYMSPEQAAGKPLDKRTDIWSFGVVLFEMLTGQRLFAGDGIPYVLGGVLRVDPDWSALPRDTPFVVRRLLTRCLQKDRKQRLRDIGDALADIDEALDVEVSAEWDPRRFLSLERSRRALPWLAAVLATAVAVLVALTSRGPARSTEDTVRVAVTLPGIVLSGAQDFAISPDGTHVAYRGADDLLFLLSLDELDATPLSGTEGALEFFFSPDGESVGFQVRGNELLSVSIFGGAPETVYLSSRAVAGQRWEAADYILAGAWSGGLVRVPIGTKSPEILTFVDADRGELGHGWPSLIQGQDAVLFTIMSDDAGAYSEQLAMLDLDTREVQRLGLAGTRPRYLPTGHLVYAGEDRALRAVPFDPETGEARGAPVSLAENVSGNFDISTTGRLIYEAGIARQAQRVWVSRDGEVDETIDTGFTVAPRLSPDGTRIAYQATGGIWILDLERGTNTKVVDSGLIPIWTPDNSHVTYTSDKFGAFQLFSQAADGSAPPELILDMAPNPVPGSWSPSGDMLAYYQTHPDTRGDLWVLPIDGRPQPFLVTEFQEVAPRVSPDGQWVAYSSNQSGEYRIYIQPFPEGGTVFPVSTGPGAEPVWSPDGRELFYRNGDQMLAVAVGLGGQLSVGRPTVLFEGDYARNTGRTFPLFDVSADGQRFLMVKPGTASDDQQGASDTILVLNWFQELKRLVPVE